MLFTLTLFKTKQFFNIYILSTSKHLEMKLYMIIEIMYDLRLFEKYKNCKFIAFFYLVYYIIRYLLLIFLSLLNFAQFINIVK
jgi:hypothetical protein